MDAPTPQVGAAICHAIRAQVAKLGLSIGDEPNWSAATLAEKTDPYSQETSLVATWRGTDRYGTATFFADGRVFAEYQVLQPHPRLTGHFVESVQVWGTPEAMRGDVVLMEMPA